MKYAALVVGLMLVGWGIWVFTDQSSLSKELGACAEVFGASGLESGRLACSASATEAKGQREAWAAGAIAAGSLMAVGAGVSLSKPQAGHAADLHTPQ